MTIQCLRSTGIWAICSFQHCYMNGMLQCLLWVTCLSIAQYQMWRKQYPNVPTQYLFRVFITGLIVARVVLIISVLNETPCPILQPSRRPWLRRIGFVKGMESLYAVLEVGRIVPAQVTLVLDVGAKGRQERGRRLLYWESYSERLYTQPDE